MNKVYHNKDIGLTVYRDTDITRNPFINKLKDLLCGIQDSNKDLQKLDGWVGVDENHYLECNGDLYYEASVNEFGFSASLKLFDYLTTGKVIICSDFKVLKEVINSKNAFFVSMVTSSEVFFAINNKPSLSMNDPFTHRTQVFNNTRNTHGLRLADSKTKCFVQISPVK